MMIRKFRFDFGKFFVLFMFLLVLVSASCVSAETFGDVQSSIDDASNTTSDTVYLNNASYDGDGSTISISKNITLTGASADNPDSYSTLDAHSLGQIVDVVEGNVTFKNLIFRNGNANVGGAVMGSNIIFINCKFINNSGINGGAIVGNNNIFNNCSFVNNSAPYGGAIYGDKAIVGNCSFVNNSATVSGGAITSNSASIMGSSFIDNSAISGGAINGTNTVVGNCSFVNNSANTGGAINGNNVSADNCSFVNNSASTNGGVMNGNNVSADNCSFVNNYAKDYGGVMNGNNVSADNCSFVNNSATYFGGAINGDNARVSNSSFVNNSANIGGVISGSNATVNGSSFVNNSATSYGGAIISSGARIIDSSFVNNSANQFSGAIYGDKNLLNNCSFVNNSAKDYGGAIRGDKIIIDNCSFVNNSANKSAGVIYGKDIVIIDSSFVNNSAHYGGAIYSTGDLAIDGSVFVDNHANWYGGAINQFDAYELNISSSNFTGNSAMYGGAINKGEGFASVVNIVSSTFANNNALFYGGAISTQGNLTIKDSLLNNNTADKGNDISLCNSSDNGITLINTDINESNIQNWNVSYFNDANVYIYCTEPMIVIGNPLVYCFNTSNIYNKYDGTPIGEYLKILVYLTINDDDAVNIIRNCTTKIFASPDYLNSSNIYVRNVLNLYDSGFRVADHAVLPFNDTHMVVFDFFELFSSIYQNRFAYNYSFIDVEKNIAVNKTTSNKTVHVGNQVIFNISVTNNGNIGLDDVYVVESKYDGFKYVGFVDKSGLWIHSIKDSKHMWSLNKTLAVGETLGFSILFEAVDVGNLTNLVIAGFGNLTVNGTETVEVNNTTSNNTTNTTNKTNKTNNITSNKTKHNEFKKNVVHSTRLYNTGNPLFLSVLALISICLVSLRRRK